MPPSSKRYGLTFFVFAALFFATAVSARADSITFVSTVNQGGTGFGNILNVLSLQNTPNESGSVLLTGMGNQLLTGNATNQSQLRSFQELINNGITNATQIGIVYNVNETGANPATTLNSFSLQVFDTQTNTLVESIFCTAGCPGVYTPFQQGTGGAGYLFALNDMDNSFATYFANPTRYVIGMTGDISGSDDGPDNFYIQRRTGQQPIPEPATMILLGTGIAGVAGIVRRRRKANEDENG